MMPLSSLGASPALDELVAVKVMGFRHEPIHDRLIAPPAFPLNHDPRWPAPPFSTDLAAAWLVVEKLAEEYDVQLGVFGDGFFATIRCSRSARTLAHVTVDPRDGGMPLAICRAALLAVESAAPGSGATP